MIMFNGHGSYKQMIGGHEVWKAGVISNEDIPFYVENNTNETHAVSIWRDTDGYGHQAPAITIYTSWDNTTWELWGTTSADTPLGKSLPVGSRLYMRATANAWAKNHNDPSTGIVGGIARNHIYGIPKVGGNIMSLLYGSNFRGQTVLTTENAFSSLFSGDSGLIDAGNLVLPVTTLTKECYDRMFQGCTGLTFAPVILPATTLAESCYNYMFSGCTALENAPELPANTLVMSCYTGMFQGCGNIDTIKCMATDISAFVCTSLWVYNVAATGTFVKNPNMSSWTIGDDGIPSGWTVVDG